MKHLSLEYIGNIVLNSFILVLLISVYFYIEKMENNGCLCANHPNKDFIKTFSIIIMVFLMITMFVTTPYVIEMFGNIVAGIYVFVKFVLYILCIVYFYMTIDYIRFLVNEKCKCSEDIRRELILSGSILEITLFIMVLLTIVIIPIIFNSFMLISNNMREYNKEFSEVVSNPMKSIRSIPSKLKSSKNTLAKMTSSLVKKSPKK